MPFVCPNCDHPPFETLIGMRVHQGRVGYCSMSKQRRPEMGAATDSGTNDDCCFDTPMMGPALLAATFQEEYEQHRDGIPHNVPGEWAVKMPPLPPRDGNPYSYCREQSLEISDSSAGKSNTKILIPRLARTEMEYLALTHKWAFSNNAADEVLHWARTSVGGPVGLNLAPSFIGLLRHSKVYNELMMIDGVRDISKLSTTGTAEEDTGFTTLTIPVPRRYTGTRKQDFLEFPFSSLLDLGVALLLDRSIVKSADDIHWRGSAPDSTGSQEPKYTPELNSGEWWARTEKKYLFDSERGVYHEDFHLLPFMVFIDDTVVSGKRNRSAKPVVITLGNLKSSVRQSEVSLSTTKRSKFNAVVVFVH